MSDTDELQELFAQVKASTPNQTTNISAMLEKARSIATLQPAKRNYSADNRQLRSPDEKEPKKLKKVLNETECEKVLQEICCKNQCNFNREFSVETIAQIRCKVGVMSENEKSNYLLNILKVSGGKYLINGIFVCQLFFIRVYSVSWSKLHNVIEAYKLNQDIITSKTEFRIFLGKNEIIKMWLDAYFDHPLIEKMPDFSGDNKIPYTTWVRLYDDFVEDMKRDGLSQNEIPTYNYFLEIRREYAPTLAVATSNQLGSCNTCHLLQDKIRVAQTPVEKELSKIEHGDHLRDVGFERRITMKIRIEAPYKIDEYLRLDIDSATIFELPHFQKKPKSLGAGYKLLSLNIVGVLDHSNKYFELNIYPKESFSDGPDKVISIIFAYLKKRKALLDINGKTFPPKLILQVDNCLKENKNHAVFGFVSSLIYHNIFQRVELHFLPVGHTHEIIDQRFSVLARGTKQQSIRTINEYVTAVKNSYSDEFRPEVNVVTEMIQFQKYILPTMFDLSKFAKNHIFAFFMDNNEVKMEYKLFHKTPTFKPPVLIFKYPLDSHPVIAERKIHDVDSVNSYGKIADFLRTIEADNVGVLFFEKLHRSKGIDYTEQTPAVTQLDDNYMAPLKKLSVEPEEIVTEPAELEEEGPTIHVTENTFQVPSRIGLIKQGNYIMFDKENQAVTFEKKYKVLKFCFATVDLQTKEHYVVGTQFELKKKSAKKFMLDETKQIDNICLPFNKAKLIFFKLCSDNTIHGNIVEKLSGNSNRGRRSKQVSEITTSHE